VDGLTVMHAVHDVFFGCQVGEVIVFVHEMVEALLFIVNILTSRRKYHQLSCPEM
jgi:hypothetical protein